MKVNGTHRPLQLDSVKDRRARAKSSKEAPSSERTTQVTVSTEARALAAARAPEAPDQSRIERLKGRDCGRRVSDRCRCDRRPNDGGGALACFPPRCS